MFPAMKLALIFLFAIINLLICLYSGFVSLQPTSHKTNKNKIEQQETRPPTLVLYVFADAPGSSSSAQLKYENIDYFVKYGLCENCTNVDYVFIVNGITSYSFPKHKNVKVIFRKELGCGAGDFEAWNDYLSQLEKNETIINGQKRQKKKYKRYMFLNDTVRGPFIDPLHRSGKDFHFTDVFGKLITDETKLVGSYLNCGSFGPYQGHAHIQSMAWMTDDVGLNVIRSNIKCYSSRWDAVNQGEIGMSKTMISSGYNIASMLLAYRGVDFRKDTHTRQTCNNLKDPTYVGTYFGQTAHPLEVIFFKDTRDTTTLSLANTYSNFFKNM